jgi:hypothetical protein
MLLPILKGSRHVDTLHPSMMISERTKHSDPYLGGQSLVSQGNVSPPTAKDDRLLPIAALKNMNARHFWLLTVVDDKREVLRGTAHQQV